MEKNLTVKTKQGYVRGKTAGNICMWLGVPYAQPPVGSLRFKRSVPAQSREGILECTEFSKWAPQKNRKNDYSNMAEDCLCLNIWSPSADGEKRPVTVYIHGGSYAAGSGAFGDCNGSIISEEGNIVAVTINYRLGILGCLDFEKYGDFDSNCGYSDVVNALKWVYENIENFGGDPENITVIGQSAGAITISALLTNEEPRKYISKAVMMSSGPTLLQTREEAFGLADKFIEMSGIDPSDLRKIPFETFIEHQNKFTSYCNLGSGTFALTVDGDTVRRFPIPAAVSGFEKHIPVIMGNTKEEMSFLFIKPIANSLEINGIFSSGVSKEPEEVKKKIPGMYDALYGKRSASMRMADLVFRLPSVWFAEAYSAHSDVWMYSFEYETIASKIAGLRAFHSTDMPFMFGHFREGYAKLTFSLTPVKTKAKKIAAVMRRDLFGFLRTGLCEWEKCKGFSTPVKAYGNTVSYHPAIDPEIKKAYFSSEFFKRSFEEFSGEFARKADQKDLP